jgi:copper transport protein
VSIPAILRLLLLLCMMGSSSSFAFAHASLIRSEPADGALLSAAPHHVVLQFSEPVAPAVLRLSNPSGETADLSGASFSDNSVTVPLPKGLERGTFAVSWRVISQDGHPVAGTVVFSIGEASAPVNRSVQQRLGLDLAIWTLRVLLYLTLFVGIGGLVFDSWANASKPSLSRIARPLRLVLLIIFPVAIASLGVLGLDALGEGWPGLLRVQTWRAALSSSYAITVFGACAASLLALAALHASRASAARALSSLALVAAGVAIAGSGHAVTAPPQFISRPAVFLHVISLTIWIGSLWPLAQLFASADPNRQSALQRFSKLIPWSVVTLLVSGAVISVLQLKPLGTLFTTAYGQILLVKLAFVACLLNLASYNRYWLTSRVLAHSRKASRMLLQSITIELGLVLAILGTVALWRFTPPPRLMSPPLPAISLHIHNEAVMAMVELAPGRVGPNRLSVVLTNPDETPLKAKELEVEVENPAAGIEPIRRQAEQTSPGEWKIRELAIPTQGRWTMGIRILVDDFRSIKLETAVVISQ